MSFGSLYYARRDSNRALRIGRAPEIAASIEEHRVVLRMGKGERLATATVVITSPDVRFETQEYHLAVIDRPEDPGPTPPKSGDLNADLEAFGQWQELHFARSHGDLSVWDACTPECSRADWDLGNPWVLPGMIGRPPSYAFRFGKPSNYPTRARGTVDLRIECVAYDGLVWLKPLTVALT